MTPTPEQIDQLIQRALEEDLGAGDITTRSIVTEDQPMEAVAVARQSLVLCGLDVFRAVFKKLDAEAVFVEESFKDGEEVPNDTTILKVRAGVSALLEGERTALNILQWLSGIATLTRKYVERARPVTVLDTRKTTPGLRVFEKYAVKCGGGTNHRFGLFDAVLIKDNHIQAAGGIEEAVERVRTNCPTPSIEVETTTLEEVKEALAARVDTIMLDNMPVNMIRQAVELVAGKTKIEVSGSVTLERMDELSTTGIDFVSVGALTHSAPAADISMNILEASSG